MGLAGASVTNVDGRIEVTLGKLATIGKLREGVVSTHCSHGETVIVSHDSDLIFNFHALLLELDMRAAAQVRAAGCPRCEGPLYTAHYPRKARGLSERAAEAGRYEVRLSLCCGREGCRARATPPSTRFSGRRVYAAVAVLVLSLGGPWARDASSSSDVLAEPQVPAWSTRARWLSWWRSGLMATPWFTLMCAYFATPVHVSGSPDSLLAQFTGDLGERLVHVLVSLAPLTTQSLSLERSRISMAR